MGPVRRSVTERRVLALRPDHVAELPDRLVTEEPLEIRAGGPGQDPQTVTVTMRTPGHDFELAVGFLFSEGVIAGRDDVREVKYCELPDEVEQQYNVVTVKLARPVQVRPRLTTTTASCGVCGTAQVEDLERRCPVLPAPAASAPRLARSVLLSLPERLRAAQSLFDRTGGLHAAGLFDFAGEPVAVREDVGRHNAVDKLVGLALLGCLLPLSERVLALSGRVSFELVQKAALAGIPVVAAVSAPSSLAVQTAERLGVCVAGFVRPPTANVYAHAERLDLEA